MVRGKSVEHSTHDWIYDRYFLEGGAANSDVRPKGDEAPVLNVEL